MTYTWSEEKPKEPGWYWWRWKEFKHDPQVMWIWIGRDGAYWTPNLFALQGGQWAGPLTEPEEPRS